MHRTVIVMSQQKANRGKRKSKEEDQHHEARDHLDTLLDEEVETYRVEPYPPGLSTRAPLLHSER